MIEIVGSGEIDGHLSMRNGDWVDIECNLVRPPVDRVRGLAVVGVGDGGPDLCVHVLAGATYEAGGRTYVRVYVSARNTKHPGDVLLGGILGFIDPARVYVPETWLAAQKRAEPVQ